MISGTTLNMIGFTPPEEGGAAGFVYVYQQKDASRYELTAKVTTRANAQTWRFGCRSSVALVSALRIDGEEACDRASEPRP